MSYPSVIPEELQEETLTPEEEAAAAAPEVPPVEAPAPASAPSEEETVETPPAEPKYVPLSALLDERERRQRMEHQLQEREQLLARWDERLRMAQAYRQEQEAARQTPPAPDPEEDPLAYQKWYNERLEQRLAAQEQRLQEFYQGAQQGAQQTQAEQQRMAHINYVQGLTQQFATQRPDYYDALNHVVNRRNEELTLMGYNDPQQRAQILQAEAEVITQGALRAQRNPAEVVYELAQRWGYLPRGATSAPPISQPGKSAPTARARLATVRRGQEVSNSLATAAGAGPEGLSLETAAAMSDDDFLQQFGKDSRVLDKLLR